MRHRHEPGGVRPRPIDGRPPGRSDGGTRFAGKRASPSGGIRRRHNVHEHHEAHEHQSWPAHELCPRAPWWPANRNRSDEREMRAEPRRRNVEEIPPATPRRRWPSGDAAARNGPTEICVAFRLLSTGRSSKQTIVSPSGATRLLDSVAEPARERALSASGRCAGNRARRHAAGHARAVRTPPCAGRVADRAPERAREGRLVLVPDLERDVDHLGVGVA